MGGDEVALGIEASSLEWGHPGWAIEAHYIASLCQRVTAVYAPECIILGGGVMERKGIMTLVTETFAKQIGDYWELPSNYLVQPELGELSGILGALEMASAV